MIADTTFLIQFKREGIMGREGPARRFFASHRKGDLIRTTIINLGEIAVSFDNSHLVWDYFSRWTIYRLTPGVMDPAADIDREMIRQGGRLRENDNWIAGFAWYYREPVISREAAFDRVRGVRRIHY